MIQNDKRAVTEKLRPGRDNRVIIGSLESILATSSQRQYVLFARTPRQSRLTADRKHYLKVYLSDSSCCNRALSSLTPNPVPPGPQ